MSYNERNFWVLDLPNCGEAEHHYTVLLLQCYAALKAHCPIFDLSNFVKQFCGLVESRKLPAVSILEAHRRTVFLLPDLSETYRPPICSFTGFSMRKLNIA